MSPWFFAMQGTSLFTIFYSFFYSGLVHLEALEQVSTQCDSKVQSLLGTMSHSDLNALKKDLIAIKDKFEIDEESDEEEEIGKVAIMIIFT